MALPWSGVQTIRYKRCQSLLALFCEAEYPAAGCVGSMKKAKPDPKEKIL